MTSLRGSKPLVVLANAPASWPSIAIIQPEFLRLLRNTFPKLEVYNFLSHARPPKNSDFWIFPAGTVQTFTLSWLRSSFQNPMSRPPAVFIWGGEGAKLGYHIWHYRDVFRPDDQWIVGCEAEKTLLDYWFPHNDRTHVMHHPVASSFRPAVDLSAKKELRRKLGLPVQKKLMLYAGRLSQQKNLIATLTLLKTLPDVKLVVCGDVDSLGVPHLQEAKTEHVPTALVEVIRRLDLSHQLEFRPYQSQSQLRMMMQACDYQISLSAHYGEDFGYSIAQGLCCGLKTVLSNWGGHKNWASLERNEQIVYLKLDWSGDTAIGKPMLPRKFALPQTKLPKTFHQIYREDLQKQLRTAALRMLSQSHPSEDVKPFQARENLIEFWSEVAKKPRPTMFSSTKHPLFRKVIETYVK